MSLGRPELLWLLLLLIVPLVLYLLPLPRRLIQSSALFLWQRFLATQRFGSVSDRFRRAMGFALLAAILICLILAAADFSIGSASTPAAKVVVLIDSSASMKAVVDSRSNLDRARQAAEEFVRSLDADTPTAIAEAADQLRVIEAMPASGAAPAAKVELARRITQSLSQKRFDGPCDIKRILDEAYGLWGGDERAEVHIFTDNELPVSAWGSRAHAWIAPAAPDNAGIVDLKCARKGKQITLQYTVANFSASRRGVTGSVLVNGQVTGSLEPVTIEPGASIQRAVSIDEPAAAAIEVRLDGADALDCDNSAFAAVPALDDMRVNVVWPEAFLTSQPSIEGQGFGRGVDLPRKRNEYVWAVLEALQGEGVAGPIQEQTSGQPPVTVWVNRLPAEWPEGNSIVLYPLKSGVIEVAGLHPEPVTVTRQASSEKNPLLADVDLRGLSVKGAVQAAVPDWATVLAWADELPLVWAGQTGSTASSPPSGRSKVLWVGIPVMPSGSRLPLVTGFPVLMRNALQWMLPEVSVGQVGQDADAPSMRRVGLYKINTADGQPRTAARSLLSASESDLRRKDGPRGETFPHRRPLAAFLVVLAMALLAAEWSLFHKRVTE